MLSSLTNALSGGSTNNTAPQAGWRKFSFFDQVSVKDAHDLDSTPVVFKAALEISTIASSSLGVLVADIHGSVHLLNREFEPVLSWVAHVAGRVTHLVERKGVLVTLGEEDTVKSPLLKIWDLKNQDGKTGAPILLRSTKVNVNNRPHPVSTVALSATLSHLAVGFADGSVILYRHLDQSLASSGGLSTLPKPRVVHENPTEPITGLGFKEPTEDNPNLSLFIVTINRVLLYHAAGRGSGGSATVVDEVGCGLGCATMDSQSKDIIIARDEAIYVCGIEGRGSCYAYEGQKISMHTHQHYLVIVSPPVVPSTSSASATIRGLMFQGGGDHSLTKVTVFDPENKFEAYNGTFESVREVISAWGQIYVLENDGKLVCLEEKPTSAKLDTLFHRSLYVLALNLAKSQKLDEASVADIHRQYGDHQYAKQDYDGAMQQFVQTIGHLQPSYVIRKFLDAQRIHNLVTYLQELHSLGRANSDHTTLLLNTYTKLKDVARLDSFIKTESRRNGDDSTELPFDLDTAIRVCRQAGYFEHASYLAKKYERHEDYLRIQIEDAENYKDALVYLRKLGPEAAESNLARYGRAMLANLPEETTQLLIDLCTTSDTLVFDPEDEPPATASSKISNSGPSYLSYLALNRRSIADQTITSDTATIPAPSIKTVRAGDTASRRDSINIDSRSSSPPPTASINNTLRLKPPPVKRLSPRIYFAHFVDHMPQFVLFLETVALRRWGQSVDPAAHNPGAAALNEPPMDERQDALDQVAVWNTLLELYLTLSDASKDSVSPVNGKNGLRDKALAVLKSDDIPYDKTHALILCSTRGYTAGLVLLWERMGMYEDVLRFWMDQDRAGVDGASVQVIAHLKLYGKEHPSLYALVLRFLTSTSALLERHRTDVGDVLAHIDQEGIMPPLGVVQVLSRNGVASVGLVKEWLLTQIRETRTEIQADKEWTESYRVESAAKLKQVEELSDPENPKVFHVGRCSTCGGQLDLPTVHFMCNHSYHQRCLVAQETECPNCAREYAVIREIRMNNERLADQHDIFLSEVKEGGFKAVADAFSRAVLNVTRPDDAGLV